MAEAQPSVVAVTGCSGRIGKATVGALLGAGYHVRVLDSSPLPAVLASHDRCSVTKGEVGAAQLGRLLEGGAAAVMHVAGTSEDIAAVRTVLAACRGAAVGRVIIASSASVFRGVEGSACPIGPETAPRPRDEDAASKLFVEALAEAFACDPAGCPTLALRFAWCPDSLEEVEAMRAATADGGGANAYLSASDAAACAVCAVSAALPTGLRFQALLCQSKPQAGAVARFDCALTESLLGWAPASVFPAGLESLGSEPGSTPPVGLALQPNTAPAPSRVRDRVSPAEWAMRVELARAYQVFAHLGWTHLIHTHITVKVPSTDPEEELFLINPYGRLWEEITASNLVKVRADGGIVDPGSNPEARINPAGFKIHSAIHTSARGKPGGDVLWTMHTHTIEVVAVASLEGGLVPGMSQYAMDLGPVAYHDFEHATSGPHVCEKMVADLGPTARVLLLRNHGCITVGKGVHGAFFRMFELICACKVQLHVQSTGLAHSLVADDIVKTTFAITEDNYTGEPMGLLEWRAAVRAMEADHGTAYRL